MILPVLPLTAAVTTLADENSPLVLERIPAFILADSAYASTQHIVPTFRMTECLRDPLNKKLNFKLASIRYTVENAFGLLKGKFRIFQRSLEAAKDNVSQAISLIAAVCTVYNMLIEFGESLDISELTSARDIMEYSEAIQREEDEGNGTDYEEDAEETEEADETESEEDSFTDEIVATHPGTRTRDILRRYMRWRISSGLK